MNTTQEEPINLYEKTKRPIVIKLFFTFLVLSLFTIFATLIIVTYAFKDILYKLPLEEFDALKNSFINHALILIIFVVIPTIVLSVFSSQDISSPIRKIGKGLKSMSDGNLDVEIKDKRQDEFGILISIFNDMIRKLKIVKERDLEVSKTKTKFITVASHQLRTPASGLGWALQVLLDDQSGNLTPKQKELLERCRTRNAEMLTIVNDLLSAAQVEDDQLSYDFIEVEVDVLLSKVITDLTLETQVKNMKIIFENKLENHTKILADPNRLTTVFINIIENAITYGTKESVIEVIVKNEDGYIITSITNQGIGIKDEDQEKLFTKFFRADNALKTKPNGSGLGLYICQKIVNYHKGKITIESELNGKTTFNIYLPLNKQEDIKDKKIEELFETM